MLNNRCLRFYGVCGLMILNLLTAGCWDRKEIENRGFVLGIGIDYATPVPKGQYDLPHVTQEAGERKYRVTFELPKFEKKSEGKSGTEHHLLYAGEGESMLAITRAIDAKVYFSLFFEDTQAIIFSEAVARDGIGDLLDFFARDPGMRRTVKMFVTPGRAENILKGKLQVDEVNSIYIAKTVQNVHMTPRFAGIINLGDVLEAIREKHSFALAEIVMENGDVKLTKGAIFNRDKKMVGELDEWETVGAKILKEFLKQGVFSIPNPVNPEKLTVFELVESHIKVDSHVQDGRLWFSVTANFIGDLDENTELGQKVLKPQFLAAVEQGLDEQFTGQVRAAYSRLQGMKADAVSLGDLVHRQHPKYWKTVKDRWDEEVFPTVPLDVKIKVTIRRPGLVR
ncbi:spore germination gerac [Lucifera butyrica]|uniref:Spore germination gerac n=1 Tax=Lucifera butyrica TaxID=1351585 RepID=A0A498RDM4_9FIRM|nr:Ger(x)C family spore germination protein [Lucifera butyrica]VBB07308.1 spore germination gerac [Lucifera butyrica]